MKHLKIKINKLEFSGIEILKDIDITINKNDKICIVGANGAGKTTLLKTIIGEIKQFDGAIENVGNMTLGYLHQVYSDDETKTVREELKSSFKDICKMEIELKELEGKMNSHPEDLDIIENYTNLLERFNHIGGYDYNNKIHSVSSGIQIFDLLDKKLTQVSGGQRTKVALAKILLESPDILFLDEPTNFIDMKSVEWLESYLQNKWKNGYIIVSHDREFLDKTCTKTIEIQTLREATIYHTNYSNYVIERDKVEQKRMEVWLREQDYLAKQKSLIDRFRAGSRAGWAKSREKSLEKMDKVGMPYIAKKPKFFFDYSGETPEKILNLKEVFIGRKDPLFFIHEATLYKHQRVGIVGENGTGKSTLLKTIIGQLDILDGFYSKGKAVKINYYSQLHEELDKEKSIRDNFYKHNINFPDQQLIGLVNHYLFGKEDLDKKVSELSGGQISKVLFAIIGQKECNLLILDEPTNHLDYDTREAMEEALTTFKGTVLFISHDRYFVNKLATHIWFISDGELSISYGNYEDYRFKIEHHIDMDKNIFDEEAGLNLVLQDKLSDRQIKKMKRKFKN